MLVNLPSQNVAVLRLGIAVAILVLGYLAGRLVNSLIKAIMDLIGLDKWLGMKGFPEVEGVSASRLLAFLARWATYLVFISIALSVYGWGISLPHLITIYGRISAFLVSLYLTLSFLYSLKSKFREGLIKAFADSVSNLSSVIMIWVLASVLILGVDPATVQIVAFYLLLGFLLPFSAILGAYTALKVVRRR